ncbi:MAG: iron-sulfur cluster assembly scaffold protein [Campylobacterales bacterium]|nr:iron-sulfur cluster assembly scaffold protein [Campylobacterales bacterium]
MKNNTQTTEHEMNKVTAEVLEHMTNPRNYGKMENADAVGMGVDKKTGEFAMIYLKIDNGTIKDVSFGCNACQDTVIAGSLFTEMIKGDTLANAVKASLIMDEKLNIAPQRQQACSRMILRAFDAALEHQVMKKSGSSEDMFVIDMNQSCEGINRDA